MLFMRSKFPPVNLDRVFSIKKAFFNTKGDMWVISFFDSANVKDYLQLQFRSEKERDSVYNNILSRLQQDMMWHIYKDYAPVNLERVFSIKTHFFDNQTKGDMWVISFFSSASSKEYLQWQFKSESERDDVYNDIFAKLMDDEILDLSPNNVH